MHKSFVFFLFVGVMACKNTAHDPNQFFNSQQQTEILKQAVRYSAKLPPNATHETKFDTAFNWYYDLAAKECDIRKVAKEKDSTYFFLMTRKARSIWPAREAIGGKMKLNGRLYLQDYEETFRTWKMTEDSLNTRAFELFERMVKGEDLTPFRARYKGDRYIEFPDDRYYFNKEQKRWRDKLGDSLRIQ